jgi:hypothetical protein
VRKKEPFVFLKISVYVVNICGGELAMDTFSGLMLEYIVCVYLERERESVCVCVCVCINFQCWKMSNIKVEKIV